MKMKRTVIIYLFSALCFPKMAYPDLFGGDVAVLSQILVQTIQQLNQLKQVVGQGQKNLELIREINKGLNETIKFKASLDLPIDSNGNFESPALHIEPSWKNRRTLEHVAELTKQASTLSNKLTDNARIQNERAERIRSHSHIVSPGGAAKLTAESQAVLIEGMNQNTLAAVQNQKLLATSLTMQARLEASTTQSNTQLTQDISQGIGRMRFSHRIPKF